MKEWYLIGNPSLSSGFENDVFNDYKSNSFAEIVSSEAGENVTFYNSDMSIEFKSRAVIQNKTADSDISSIKRQLLAEVGTLNSYHYIKDKSGVIWLLKGKVDNNGIYDKSAASICNYKLHWQNESGEIVSRYAHVLNASAYNNGEKETKTLTLQSNQFMVYLPYDDETMLLDNNMRIHMSKNIQKCRPYELTRVDDISYDFSDKGLINLIFTQTLASPGNDKLVDDGTGNKVWICDYRESATPPSPTDPGDNEEPNRSPILLRTEIVYKGNPELKIGGTYKAFTGKFYDESNSEVNDIGVWSIDTIDELSKFVDFATTGNTIKIKILNYDSAIGGIVRLKYSSTDGKFSKILDVSILSGI
jgi:hypothetical protein